MVVTKHFAVHSTKYRKSFIEYILNPENRRLARYDYVKMNLTSAIKLEQVEKEIAENQNSLTKWIDDYEYKIRRLEKFVKILNGIEANKDNKKPNILKIL